MDTLTYNMKHIKRNEGAELSDDQKIQKRDSKTIDIGKKG